MATTLTSTEFVATVSEHTHRLRCTQCHRFLGVAGLDEVPCVRCDVTYVKQPDGTYRSWAKAA